MSKTQIETVAQVRARQMIWTEWMRNATEGLADDALVQTTTESTPFGRYLIGISRLNEEGQR